LVGHAFYALRTGTLIPHMIGAGIPAAIQEIGVAEIDLTATAPDRHLAGANRRIIPIVRIPTVTMIGGGGQAPGVPAGPTGNGRATPAATIGGIEARRGDRGGTDRQATIPLTD
jgi:hypothetical protein